MKLAVQQTSCLNNSHFSCTEMILQTGTRNRIEYDFCPHRENLVVVSHKVKSFQWTGSFATGSFYFGHQYYFLQTLFVQWFKIKNYFCIWRKKILIYILKIHLIYNLLKFFYLFDFLFSEKSFRKKYICGTKI